jgi:hypothetical protein
VRRRSRPSLLADQRLYLDEREDVDHYWVVMERLRVDAEPTVATRDILGRILNEL